MRKVLITIILTLFFCPIVATASYSDIPHDHWALDVIEEATASDIIRGRTDGTFGLGETVKRSEFAAMLNRMMKWEQTVAGSSPFDDVQQGDWYYADVNMLAARNVYVGEKFRPEENITRSEMAVMLVSALGYQELADSVTDCPFMDVTINQGYISVAHSLGIINGKGEGAFDPEGFALREEAAAMMIRMYRKLNATLREINGFYAISSWSQRNIAAQMDTVSFGWSRLQFTDEGNVYLSKTPKDGNDWFVPDGSEDALAVVRAGGALVHLAVTMTDFEDCRSILLNPLNRREAIEQLMVAASDYDGITIDFEGMKGNELKSGLNEFVKELKTALGNKRLYVAVHPKLKNSYEYFDAYDYKTIGLYADSVILMAHDYAASVFPEELLNTEFIATPVTPFEEIYAALVAVTDPQTGVADLGKVQFALSPASTVAWKTNEKKVIDTEAIHPSMETILKRLSQTDTEIHYSHRHENPYAWYETESGEQILLWYEDSRSVQAKIDLAKMFGIEAVSVWRIGVIPNDCNVEYMNVWDSILSNKQAR